MLICTRTLPYFSSLRICLCKLFSGTLYDGEVFQLQFTFGNRYPFDSPQVSFYMVYASRKKILLQEVFAFCQIFFRKDY